MQIKKVIKGDEARVLLFKGLSTVVDTVASTAGPSGRNVAIQQDWGVTKLTKDGVSVSKSIMLNGPEGEGAKMIVAGAEKTNRVGDGTTNTCIIAKAIAEEGLKNISKGRRSTDIKKGIDMAVEKLKNGLKTISKDVVSNDEIKQVATVSANGDNEIGEIIANAVENIGRDGVITVEEGKSLATELEVVEGLRFDQGYLSPYFMTNPERQLVELDNPFLFLYDGKVNTIQSIVPLLEQISQSGRPIIIIADEVDAEPLSLLVLNNIKGGLKCCAVKAPSYGDIRKMVMEDIATLTGGQFITTQFGKETQDITIDMLGTCDKIKVSPTETTIIGGHGSKEAINERVEQIKTEIEVVTSSYDREKLRERVARLTNGVAIIKVGGATEMEVKEKKDRVDDATCAVRAALEEGIVPGGGISLIKLVKQMDSDADNVNSDIKCGMEIVYKAVDSQLKTIADNAGKSGEVVVEKVKEQADINYGYDARNDEYCDLVERGIIDPTKVVRCALENGASVAGSLLTVESLIVDDLEANAEIMKMYNRQPQM